MDEELESFVSKIPGFDEILQSERIDYFVYYLNVVKGMEGASPSNVAQCFKSLNLPEYSVRQYLSTKAKKTRTTVPRFIKNSTGYVLERGRNTEIEKSLKINAKRLQVGDNLRTLLEEINSETEREFLLEAIECYEIGAYRAAIVMGWLLTVDHLYQYILDDSERLAAFNLTLSKQNDKRIRGLIIKTKDDFSDIPEGIYIRLCRSSKIISNDVRKILDEKLGIRNTSAHPSGIKILESKATEFLEDLVKNVIQKF